MKIPACSKPGNNYEGDESLCTFEAFKRVADGYVPKNWKVQCGENLDKPAAGLDSAPQMAGQIEEGF